MPPNRQESEIDRVRIASQYLPIRNLFSVVELRLFRYTAVLFSLVVLTMLVGTILWAFGWILEMFYSLILSLSLAGILALVLYPVVEFFERRIHLPRLLAIIILLAAFFIGIGGLIFLLVPILISQIVQMMTVLPEALANWQEYFSAHFPRLSEIISSSIENSGGQESKPVLPGLEESGGTLMSYLELLVGISFVPLFLFFALRSGNSLRGQASELLSVFHRPTQQKTLYFMEVFVEYVTTFFQGQLIIALCMGILYALSFTLIGLEFGMLIGLILGLLNIVPFLGTLIGLLVILPMAYLQGVELLLLATLVFSAVQLIESWLLTPKIMANRSGLHPALVVISLFFWGTALNGIIGMVLAVPLTAFFVAIWSEIKVSLKHTLSSRDARP
ncbi:AI-2E family transporter [Aliiglaciecola sp. CAU 1673]|uniref:AI-2E family transporter n=1 Tax=Aliiglaciecola sp. CAU 1673 TaxID=3032595 RepID=UPI0023D9CAA2|nr:AI-2E family transporter [Aliiglaciecola sp. CAU 1673]MDF2178945.1 AI-2E family transporter [Aliiglaciecola sp. CAU 1673]